MDVVNTHAAKTQLSKLLARVEAGESIVIAKAGTPIARLVPYEEDRAPRLDRLGFMNRGWVVPEDFDSMMADEILQMFGLEPDEADDAPAG